MHREGDTREEGSVKTGRGQSDTAASPECQQPPDARRGGTENRRQLKANLETQNPREQADSGPAFLLSHCETLDETLLLAGQVLTC